MSPRSNHDIEVLVAELGDAPGAKGFKASSKWFDTVEKGGLLAPRKRPM